MLQITLVAHEHNNDVTVCMIPQLLQPSLNIFVCQMFRYVINQQSADSSTIVPVRKIDVQAVNYLNLQRPAHAYKQQW